VDDRNLSIFHNIIFPKRGILHIKLLSPGMESGLGHKLSLQNYDLGHILLLVVKLNVECLKTVQRSERMTTVVVMLRFETINGNINVYRDSKYKRGQTKQRS